MLDIVYKIFWQCTLDLPCCDVIVRWPESEFMGVMWLPWHWFWSRPAQIAQFEFLRPVKLIELQPDFFENAIEFSNGFAHSWFVGIQSLVVQLACD